MSLFHLALNENISNEDFIKLVEQKIKNNERLHAVFNEGLESLKTNEQRAKYIQSALPVLMMFTL